MPNQINPSEKKLLDQKLLRAMLITKNDAINLCEQVAQITSNEKIKSLLRDLSREEEAQFYRLKKLLQELQEEN